MARNTEFLGGNNQIEIVSSTSYVDDLDAVPALLTLNSNGTDGFVHIGTTTTKYALGATADAEGVRYNFSSTATTGTNRGEDVRLLLSSGAGGESIRAFTTVSSNSPADTVNGIHSSLGFSASAGNVTGLGTAVRGNVLVPNRTLTGTIAGVQGELYASGASSDVSAGACFRAVIDGEATGKAAMEDSVFLFDVSTGTNASGNVVSGVGNEPTWASATHKIRIRCNGVTMYIPATLA